MDYVGNGDNGAIVWVRDIVADINKRKSLDWDSSWGCNCTWLPKTISKPTSGAGLQPNFTYVKWIKKIL